MEGLVEGKPGTESGISPISGVRRGLVRFPQPTAYRFARGEEVIASSGQPVRLARPLDWLAITDHSDGMGFVTDVLAASPLVTKYEQGARWSKGMRAGGQEAVNATLNLIATVSQGKVDREMFANYSPGSRRYATLWDEVIDAAEQCNDPGHFTAFIAFEWTSLVNGGNMHRNVIFRDNGDRARHGDATAPRSRPAFPSGPGWRPGRSGCQVRSPGVGERGLP